MVGGGVHGKVVGIARITMTGDGLITAMFQVFILMSTQAGEDTTDTTIGMVTGGTMNGFLTSDCNRTGSDGIMTDIGKGKEHGVSRTINPDRKNRNRN
jgi:hypothetical protein